MRDTLEMNWTLQPQPSVIYQLLHAMEETAAAHTVVLGIPRPVMVERYGVVWMIVRSWMELDAQPDVHVPLTVRTWHRGLTGGVIYRDFDLIQNGVRIGQAVQTWVLVDINSRTLFRMSKVAELANSPRPETVSTTMSSGRKSILARAPRACALSRAGMMPSRRVSSKAAATASSSFTGITRARPCAARFACIGPMPG